MREVVKYEQIIKDKIIVFGALSVVFLDQENKKLNRDSKRYECNSEI